MINKWKKDGWIFLKNQFDHKNIAHYAEEILKSPQTDYFIYENDNQTVRSVFSPHLIEKNINFFVKNNPVVSTVKQLLSTQIYLHQCHFNYKRSQTGGEYDWHSDYTFWKCDDNMKKMDAVSCMFFLDNVTLDNGPLEVLTGSQNILVEKKPSKNYRIKHNKEESNGIITESMINSTGLEREIITGQAGDVFIMHGNLWHSSSPNSSDLDRRILIVCYNDLNNKTSNHLRPEFITSRDFTPI